MQTNFYTVISEGDMMALQNIDNPKDSYYASVHDFRNRENQIVSSDEISFREGNISLDDEDGGFRSVTMAFLKRKNDN